MKQELRQENVADAAKTIADEKKAAGGRAARFFVEIPKRGKIKEMATKYIKWP
jgi:hypothetical protein